MKKKLAMLLVLGAAFALTACGSGSSESTAEAETEAEETADETETSEAEETEETEEADAEAEEEAASDWVWERDIEWVCMYDVGSGTDSTMRALSDQVAAELGVNIVINNVSGGSGLTGMEYFYTQPADGYTYGMLGISHVLAGLKGTASFDVKSEMTAVACLAQDNEMIFANTDLPFDDWEGLVEYAQENPGDLTLGLTSINGVDAASVQQLFNEAGIEITLVAVDSELYSMVIGGHVDLAVGSPNECKEYVDAGQLNALITINTIRSSAFPDTPCSADFGYDAEIGPWRAIFARTGTPEAAIESLDAAIQKVMNEDPSWAEYLELNGLNDRPAQMDHVEMQEYWLEQFDVLGELVTE